MCQHLFCIKFNAILEFKSYVEKAPSNGAIWDELI